MRLILAALLLFLPALASADEYRVASRLLCSGQAAIFQIARDHNRQPPFAPLPLAWAQTFADARESPDLSCDLGTKERPRLLQIKTGTFGGVHYGACGGATKHFLSMWVGRKRILSRRMFDTPCDMFQNLDLIYFTESTLVFCARANSTMHPQGGIADTGANPDLACTDMSHVFAQANAGPEDAVQYPPHGGPRREGHVMLLRSSNPLLCTYLLQEFGTGKGFYDVFDRYRAKTGTPAPDWTLGPLSPSVSYRLDINNDRLPDTLAVSPYGPGSIGERLHLLADGRDGAALPDPLTPNMIASYPVLVPVGETVFGEGRPATSPPYVLVQPFAWEGVNHLLLSTVYDQSPPEWAVYLVRPDYGFDEICVLDREPIHY